MKNLAEEIVRIAKQEVGIEEVDGTNCGKRVDEYKATTVLDAKIGWPWCAAFVCWVIKQALQSAGVMQTHTFKRPRTAGAWDFERWSMEQDASTSTRKPHGGDIAAGDIVIFTFSHIGIAISSPDANGYIQTIEGNTDASGSREGGGVYNKARHISKIRSRIRFRQEKLIPSN